MIYYSGARPSLPTWNDIPDSRAGTTGHHVAGLTNGTEYTFEVRAQAAATPGAASVATATPRACPEITVDGLNDTTVTLGDALSLLPAVSGGEGTYAYALSVDPASGSEISVDEQEGTITGTPTVAGAYAVTVTATDDNGCTGTGAFTLQVCPVITVTGLGDTTVTTGDLLSITARATGGCGTITYTMTGAPTDIDIETITENGEEIGRITGPAAPAGAYEVTVTATDAAGNTGEGRFTITAECPEITVGGLRDTSVTVGRSVTMTAEGSGSEASYWYFISSDPDEGISPSIHERNGAITVTTAAAGEYTVTVRVRDDHGCTGRGTFTLKVCPVITVTQPQPPVSVRAGATATVTVSAMGGCGDKTFSDPSGLSWARRKQGSPNQYTVTPPAGTAPGPYTFDVTATDAEGNTGTGTMTVTVTRPPPPPPCPGLTIDAISNVRVSVNQSFSRTARARGGCDPITITMSGAPSGVTMPSGRGRSKTISSSGLSSEDTHTVTVTATDARGTTARRQFEIVVDCPSISVSQSPANPQVAVGDSVIVTAIASGGCGSHTYSNPSGLSWVRKKEGTRNEYVAKPTAGTAIGTHRFSVTATDDYENTGTGRLKVKVIEPPVVCDQIEFDNIADVKVKAGGTKTTTASAQDNGCPRITFGKKPNSGTPTWVTVAEGGGITVSPPAGTAARSYTATVTATDARENAKDASFTITVCDPVVINRIPNETVVVGEKVTITPSARGGCGSITYTQSGTLPPDVTFNSETDVISGTTKAAGVFTATVTATDSKLRENTASSSFTLTVICPTISVVAGADVAVAVNGEISRTVTASGGVGPHGFSLSVDPSSGLDMSIGQENGQITGSASKPGTYTVTVSAWAKSAPDCPRGTDTFTVTVECPSISVGGLPSDEVVVTLGDNMPTVTATASGGQAPYTFGMTGIPDGIRLDPGTGGAPGSITGGPTPIGKYTIEVTATDDCGCTGSGTFDMDVVRRPPPTVQCPAAREVTVGGTIGNIHATASGGTPPYTFRTPTVRPSAGLDVSITQNGSTGTISGNAIAVGTYQVTVPVDDSDSESDQASCAFTVTVVCPEIAYGGPGAVTVNVGGSTTATMTASGGLAPYTFAKASGPAWVTIVDGSTITVSDAPDAPGTHAVGVRIRDARGCAGTGSFTVNVTCPPITMPSISKVAASKNVTISTIQVSPGGGCPPFTYRLSANAGRAGLSISSSGAISGAPPAIGSWQITVFATDANGSTVQGSFWVRVAEPLVIGPISDMIGEIRVAFSEGPVDVSGGVIPYDYSLSGQPSGLDVNDDGEIEGTPTESGDFDVTLTVTDNDGRTESILFFIMISSGDFNRDGRADAEDSALFSRKFGLRSTDAEYDRRMDMNRDGIINMADMVILTRHIERDAARRGRSGSDGGGG